ncbi:MAG: hypothetical protein WCF16_02860, partial [Alphaproteobacteria bacterium]
MLAWPTICGMRGGAKGALLLSCCLALTAAMPGQTGDARADDAYPASASAGSDSGALEAAATEIAENQVSEVQSGAPAGGDGESFAGPAVAAVSPAELPRPLSDDDARRYERIFAL